MYSFGEDAVVHGDIAAIWRVATDVDAWPSWDPHEEKARLDGPFHLIFIDADKENNPAYVREAIRLSRPGPVIVVDNVIREGGVVDTASEDPRIRGTRALFDYVSSEPRLTATAIQTVGVKKWDGFLLAVVDVDGA